MVERKNHVATGIRQHQNVYIGSDSKEQSLIKFLFRGVEPLASQSQL